MLLIERKEVAFWKWKHRKLQHRPRGRPVSGCFEAQHSWELQFSLEVSFIGGFEGHGKSESATAQKEESTWKHPVRVWNQWTRPRVCSNSRSATQHPHLPSWLDSGHVCFYQVRFLPLSPSSWQQLPLAFSPDFVTDHSAQFCCMLPQEFSPKDCRKLKVCHCRPRGKIVDNSY